MKSIESVLNEVMAEMQRAVTKFPTWPDRGLDAFAIIGEEVGELQKEVLQLTYEPHKADAERMRKEAVQTAAMALRFLMSIDEYKFEAGTQHKQTPFVWDRLVEKFDATQLLQQAQSFKSLLAGLYSACEHVSSIRSDFDLDVINTKSINDYQFVTPDDCYAIDGYASDARMLRGVSSVVATGLQHNLMSGIYTAVERLVAQYAVHKVFIIIEDQGFMDNHMRIQLAIYGLKKKVTL